MLRRLFDLESGEAVTFGLLSLSLFLAIGGNFVVGRTVSRSLFLSSLPPEYIPFRFIAVTVGVVLVSSQYARVVAHYRRDRLMLVSTAAMIAGVLLYRLLLATPLADSLLLLGSLFVYLEIMATLTIVQFWTLASEILNAREAKRLFPPIGAMGNLGSIIAGALISIFVATLGTDNLLVVLAALMTAYATCVWALGRLHASSLSLPEMKSNEHKAEEPSLAENFRDLRRTPLLLSMAAIVVLMTMATNVVDYQFDLTLQASFTNNADSLSSFLGSFYFWAGLAGFVVQLAATGPVLRRFGLVISLSVLPLAFALGSGIVLVSAAALWAVTLTRSSDPVFRYTINDTAFGLLYLPIPRAVRAGAKAVIDGILKPTAIGVVGLLFLFVGTLRGISPLPWSFLVLLLVVGWLLLVIRVKRQYVDALASSIRSRQFDPTREVIDLTDETTIGILKDTLRQSQESRVLQAFSLIDEVPHLDWVPSLLPLLDHESSTVRCGALQRLASQGTTIHAEAVWAQIDAPEAEVRAAAIQAYCSISGVAVLEDILPYIDDPEPAVRQAAIVGAIQFCGLDGVLQAAPALRTMVTDPDPAMRAAAASALGQLEIRTFFQPLHRLMADEVREVQRRALQAASNLRHPRLLPALVEKLGDPAMTAAAAQAILAYGAGVVPRLERFFTDPDTPIAVRRQIPRVVGRSLEPDSPLFLLGHLDHPDNRTRARIYKALVRLQASGMHIPANKSVLETSLETELGSLYELVVRRSNLATVEHAVLLEDGLTRHQQYATDRVFYLLGLLYPGSNMAQVRTAAFDPDIRRRANAIELLDTILAQPIKDNLLPLLEGTEERRILVAHEQFSIDSQRDTDCVAQLARHLDPWIAACALYTVGQNGWQEHAPLVRAAFSAPQELVREAALVAGSRLLPPDEFRTALKAQAEDPAYPNLQIYASRWLGSSTAREQGVNGMPLSTLERVLFLRGVDLFQEISGEDLSLVTRVCSEVHYPARERFVIQGDVGDCLYVLVDGEVSVQIAGVGEIARRSSGDVIGEMAIISNRPRSADCMAATDVTLLRIDRTDFWDLMGGYPTLSLGVIKVLSARLYEAVATMEGLAETT